MKFLYAALVFAIVFFTVAESTFKPTVDNNVVSAMEKFKKVDVQFTLFYLDHNTIKNLDLSEFNEPMKMLNKHDCIFSFCHHQYDCKEEHVMEDCFLKWCVEGKNDVTKKISDKVVPVLNKRWGNLAKKTLNMYGTNGTDQAFIARKLCNNETQ